MKNLHWRCSWCFHYREDDLNVYMKCPTTVLETGFKGCLDCCLNRIYSTSKKLHNLCVQTYCQNHWWSAMTCVVWFPFAFGSDIHIRRGTYFLHLSKYSQTINIARIEEEWFVIISSKMGQCLNCNFVVFQKSIMWDGDISSKVTKFTFLLIQLKWFMSG